MKEINYWAYKNIKENSIILVDYLYNPWFITRNEKITNSITKCSIEINEPPEKLKQKFNFKSYKIFRIYEIKTGDDKKMNFEMLNNVDYIIVAKNNYSRYYNDDTLFTSIKMREFYDYIFLNCELMLDTNLNKIYRNTLKNKRIIYND